jgi:hypothetical protein
MTSKRKTRWTTLRQYISRQAKPKPKRKPKLWQMKEKQLLQCRIVTVGSSYRVEEGIDKVESLPAALL